MGLPEEAKGSNSGQEGAGHKNSPAHRHQLTQGAEATSYPKQQKRKTLGIWQGFLVGCHGNRTLQRLSKEGRQIQLLPSSRTDEGRLFLRPPQGVAQARGNLPK